MQKKQYKAKHSDSLHSDNHTKKVKAFVSQTISALIAVEPTKLETRQIAAALDAIRSEILESLKT